MTVDRWTSGDSYERFMGRWSRLVADRFVDWLRPDRQRDWLDVGCGTGELTRTILSKAEPTSVRGIEPSPSFVEGARERTSDPRAHFGVGDASSIEAEDASFGYVVSGLVLNFVPDAKKALAEMSRVAGPGGKVAAYVWDYGDGMQMLRYFWDAVSEVDPPSRELDEGVRFPICRPDALTGLWGDAFTGVELEAIEVPTVFSGFDDYWSPFLGGQGPAPTCLLALPDAKRVQVRELLRKRLPVDPEGRVPLTARAWAVRGTRET